MTKKPYYITTAIAYTSGKPHIGNTYEIVLADLLARFKRKQGYDAVLQTGTDEHGEKIQQKAQQANVTPKEYVDKVAGEIKRIWDIMDTTYDKFVRTTDNYHELQVQKIFEKLLAQGDIYKGNYTGWYCTPCESFWTESQLVDREMPRLRKRGSNCKRRSIFLPYEQIRRQIDAILRRTPRFYRSSFAQKRNGKQLSETRIAGSVRQPYFV